MTKLTSTMAGSVFKVNMNVGDQVESGQVVLILESMKMEIPIEAEASGTVAEINANEGDFVNEGDVLVTLK